MARKNIRDLIAFLIKDKSGASVREYAFIVGAVSLLILAGAVGQSGGVRNFLAAVRSWLPGL